MFLVFIVHSYLKNIMDISHVTAVKLVSGLDDIESHLQGEDFLPNWSQCLVLSVCVHPVIHYLKNCKRITFTSQISRMESLSFDNFHNKVTNILHLVQGVCHFLKLTVSYQFIKL